MQKKYKLEKEDMSLCNCQNPVNCWYCGEQITKDGVISPKLVFSLKKARQYHQTDTSLDSNFHPLPCGKCAYCQIRKRKDMTVRLAHERSLYQDCCFLTLTYNDKNIPTIVDYKEEKGKRGYRCEGSIVYGGNGLKTLIPSDVQLFMKRLRRHLEYQPKKLKGIRDHIKTSIRYFAVGEYGSKTHRPHYHILIFGWRPSDLRIHQYKIKEDGTPYYIYRSSQIEKLWTSGFSTVMNVDYGVAKYCARYVTKKFARIGHTPTEEDKIICPEFTLQSVRNGGIGAPWLSKYYKNLANNFVTVRSGDFRISICSVPKYYLNRLRKINQPFWLKLRSEKIEFLSTNPVKYKSKEELQNIVDKELEIYKYQIRKETF